MHSVAMGAGARNRRDSGLPHALPERTYQTSAQLVRLSHLRKLCECEQVAAVCYRWRGDGIEFLLVRTRGGGRWTFPKGSAGTGAGPMPRRPLWRPSRNRESHGRIEEASFATYVRRGPSRGTGRSDAKSGEKKFGVSAHLCEVSRLSAPKESGRNRTWFSAAEARQRLREGRRSEDGAEFAGVIHKAVARLQWLQGGTGIVDDRPQDRPQQNGLQRDTLQTDGLSRKCGSRLSRKRPVEKLCSCRTFAANSTGCGNSPCLLLTITLLRSCEAKSCNSTQCERRRRRLWGPVEQAG